MQTAAIYINANRVNKGEAVEAVVDGPVLWTRKNSPKVNRSNIKCK